MADGRMLLRTIAWDGRLAQLSITSEYLFLKAIPHQDDHGRMPGLPAFFRGTVVPARAEKEGWDDGFIHGLVEEWRWTVDDSGVVSPLALVGRVSGVLVCQLAGFEKTQRLKRRRPSLLPAIADTAAMIDTAQQSLFSVAASRTAPADAELPVGSAGAGPSRETPAKSELLSEAGRGGSEEKGSEEKNTVVDELTLADQTDDAAELDPVRVVYDCWRAERNRQGRRYATMSHGRRTKIQARLKEFTAEELCDAIRAVASDPWPERGRHDDLTIILRSREQVDRFLEMRAGGQQQSRGFSRGLEHLERYGEASGG